MKYKELRKGFVRARRLGLEKKEKIKGLPKFEKEIVALERRLQRVKSGMERGKSQ